MVLWRFSSVWTVELAPEFEPELLALAAEVRIELLAQARVIERFGPTTGSSPGRYAQRVEARQHERTALRRRRRRVARCLRVRSRAQGDPAGCRRQERASERAFYRRLIATADRRFDAHLDRVTRRQSTELMEKPMPRSLNEVVAALPEGERAQIETRARELVAEEMSLRQLRKALGKTQTAVAKRLKVGQDAVSKVETRGDMYVSTLRDFIKAMGGELQFVAQFPDRPPVCLEKLGTIPLRRMRHHRRLTRDEIIGSLRNSNSETARLAASNSCNCACRLSASYSLETGSPRNARSQISKRRCGSSRPRLIPCSSSYEHASETVVAALEASDSNPLTEDQAQSHIARKKRLITGFYQLEGQFNPRASSSAVR